MGKVILLLGLAVALVAAAPSTKIESRLANTLINSRANILVSMKEDTSSVLSSFKNAKYANHGERTTAVAHALMAFAQQSQKEAITLLNKESVQHKVFWITNQIFIRDATTELVKKLASLESVSEITEEFEVKLNPVIPSNKSPPIGILAEWGIENVEAPAVWADGNTGENVIVGIIDTGVRATHKDLYYNYVGTYGWLDATDGASQVPRDGNGHGTHVMGTIVGQNGIGVAPGAKYMACKGLSDLGSGTNAGLIECGQFMACPSLPDGSEPDCSKSPHIVSNSWGGGQSNPFFNTVINAWHTANIIPIFAIGSGGPECGSVSKSLSKVISVGATQIGNEVAEFSGRGSGPVDGSIIPDITAPGVDIKSAWSTSDSSYNTISGTSMATPHVAGVIALVKSTNMSLNYDQIYEKITSNANRDVVDTGANCGGIRDTDLPNYVYGYGIVNARMAVSV